MFKTVVDCLDFVLLGLLFSASTVSILLYIGAKTKSALWVTAYCLLQIILELEVRLTEVNTPLSRWTNDVLLSTAIYKGLTYCLLIYVMMEMGAQIFGKRLRWKHWVVPGLTCLWLMITPTLQKLSIVFFWTYLIPMELCLAWMGFYGLRAMKRCQNREELVWFLPILKLLAIASLLMVAEDLFSASINGFFEPYSYDKTDLGFMYVKERNFIESLLQVVFAGIVAVRGSMYLISLLRQSQQVKEAPPVLQEQVAEPQLPAEESWLTYRIAEELGLSQREREILPFLLDNKTSQEIGEQLFISQGTVKSHMHNIYQKANVRDRASLIKLAQDYQQQN